MLFEHLYTQERRGHGRARQGPPVEIEPKFRHSLWSVYYETQDVEVPLTNNFSEANNSSWTKSLERSPNLYTFLTQLKRKENMINQVSHCKHFNRNLCVYITMFQRLREDAMEHSVNVENGKERTITAIRRRADMSGFCAAFESFSTSNFFEGLVGFTQ